MNQFNPKIENLNYDLRLGTIVWLTIKNLKKKETVAKTPTEVVNRKQLNDQMYCVLSTTRVALN